MATLKELETEIARTMGAPYLERCRKADKGGANWHLCEGCGNYVQGVCLPCKNSGLLVKPLGSLRDMWP